MSRDSNFVTKSSHNPDSGYNSQLFNIIGPPNTNSLNSLNHPPHDSNSNNNCFNTSGSTWGNFPDVTVTDDRSELLTWLSPLEPRSRHYDIQARRVDGVGDWLLETEQFRSWYSADDQCGSRQAAIYCYGNPGVGKTYISSLVIDSLCDVAGGAGEDITVACFYLDFAAQKEQSATNILRTLLKQVVSGLEKIPNEIMDAFRSHKRVIGGYRLLIPEIVKLLGSLSSLRRTFICLDALDECATEDRATILLSLGNITKMSPTTRVFLTGRPHVRSDVERRLPEGVVAISINPRKGDIIRYIHTKLAGDITPDEMDKELEAEIVRRVPETVSEIFLLVSLNMDAILQETTIHRRRERLRRMTDGLGLEDAYGSTLDRIKAQGGQRSRLGVSALMWICHSERPLRAEELCQALAVEIGSTDYNDDNVSSIRTVLSCCQGFAMLDKEGSPVRLIHHTLQAYLTGHRNLFQSPHSTIAETCLTYLNSQQVMALSGSCVQSAQHSSFLQYSSLYWGAHMKKELTDRGKALALRLFSHYEGHVSIELLLEHTLGRYSLRSIVDYCRFGGLHCASMFGLVELVRVLIEVDGVDTNCVDDTGATPLIWAARNGHEAVARLLLGREDVSPDRPDDYGQTPLSQAAENGHETVVKLLLGREGVNPDKPDSGWGRTPILWAAKNGHIAIVKMLLEQEVDPDRPDDHGQTPISWAAENGHRAVAKLLLERVEVDPDRPDNHGQTPTSWAAVNGHAVVVKLLLGREGVNPDRPDNHGQTPISWAAEGGHEEVVKMLLELGEVNPDRPDNGGQTPISWAAVNGQEAVVKILLEQEVDLDRPDIHGQTPILWAAVNGHEEVVKLLLEREEVNPNRPDNHGQTPISWAAANGHEEVVKMLLKLGEVNPDRPDNGGQTPISWAAVNGHGAVVKMLLEREEVDPDRPDCHGQTPISWAAVNGHGAVVKMLLERGEVNPDRPDCHGQTPISWAAANGHDTVVKILLEQEVNPDRPDIHGQTPILWAAVNGHGAVVKRLLERKEVNPVRPDNHGQTPISWAAVNGHEAVVEMLLERGRAKPNRLDFHGQTPISWDAVAGHEEVVKLLLEHKKVNPDRPDNRGQAPFLWASLDNHEGSVPYGPGRW